MKKHQEILDTLKRMLSLFKKMKKEATIQRSSLRKNNYELFNEKADMRERYMKEIDSLKQDFSFYQVELTDQSDLTLSINEKRDAIQKILLDLSRIDAETTKHIMKKMGEMNDRHRELKKNSAAMKKYKPSRIATPRIINTRK